MKAAARMSRGFLAHFIGHPQNLFAPRHMTGQYAGFGGSYGRKGCASQKATSFLGLPEATKALTQVAAGLPGVKGAALC